MRYGLTVCRVPGFCADIPDWSDMRLLIVEDNEELAELLAKGLRTAGKQQSQATPLEGVAALPHH